MDDLQKAKDEIMEALHKFAEDGNTAKIMGFFCLLIDISHHGTCRLIKNIIKEGKKDLIPNHWYEFEKVFTKAHKDLYKALEKAKNE